MNHVYLHVFNLMFILVLFVQIISACAYDADDIPQQSRSFFAQHKTNIQASSSQTMHDYYKTIRYLGYTIQTTDDFKAKL